MSYDSSADTLSHIRRVMQLLNGAAMQILGRAMHHDDSKLKSPEKEMFDKFTPQLRALEYGSDKYKAVLEEMGPALQHHYQQNLHHPEHYKNGVNDMDLYDVLEMFCDWKAASERHATGDFLKSIEVNTERFGLSEQLKQILINTGINYGFIPFEEKQKRGR